MHIYAYGSICRGDLVPTSDIDLLALVDEDDGRFDAGVFSVYRYDQLPSLWSEGNPFAWHLALESRLIFAEDGEDFIRALGTPLPYRRWGTDSEKFAEIYGAATCVLQERRDTSTFELSTVYLAIRNLAICFSLHVGNTPVFSRRAFKHLGIHSLDIDSRTSQILEDARILSTRGIGSPTSKGDLSHVLSQLPTLDAWITAIRREGDSWDV